jgi:hypothetical protein
VVEQAKLAEEMKTVAGQDKWLRERYGDEMADYMLKVTYGKNYKAFQNDEPERKPNGDEAYEDLLKRIIKLEYAVSEIQREIIAELKTLIDNKKSK